MGRSAGCTSRFAAAAGESRRRLERVPAVALQLVTGTGQRGCETNGPKSVYWYMDQCNHKKKGALKLQGNEFEAVRPTGLTTAASGSGVPGFSRSGTIPPRCRGMEPASRAASIRPVYRTQRGMAQACHQRQRLSRRRCRRPQCAASGSRGYSNISTVTPMAPAPTDVRVTRVPMTAPNSRAATSAEGRGTGAQFRFARLGRPWPRRACTVAAAVRAGPRPGCWS